MSHVKFKPLSGKFHVFFSKDLLLDGTKSLCFIDWRFAKLSAIFLSKLNSSNPLVSEVGLWLYILPQPSLNLRIGWELKIDSGSTLPRVYFPKHRTYKGFFRAIAPTVQVLSGEI
ncbi:MAG TPA: hypothetical protein DD379_12595 [Cyanobacteria bacterium UBA11162]|nr:hypothetical protein [Cyanobacteria bacterium UBA11162]